MQEVEWQSVEKTIIEFLTDSGCEAGLSAQNLVTDITEIGNGQRFQVLLSIDQPVAKSRPVAVELFCSKKGQLVKIESRVRCRRCDRSLAEARPAVVAADLPRVLAAVRLILCELCQEPLRTYLAHTDTAE